MNNYYNVHYPDGTTKKHKNRYNDRYLPKLGGIFYAGIKDNPKHDTYPYDTYCFEIVEIGEEDVWVENISPEEFLHKIHGVMNFVYFEYADINSPKLCYQLVEY